MKSFFFFAFFVVSQLIFFQVNTNSPQWVNR